MTATCARRAPRGPGGRWPPEAGELAAPEPGRAGPPPPAESVPLAPVESAPSAPPPAAPSAAAAVSAVPEILVVVGEPELRDRLEEVLAAAGYEVPLLSDAARRVGAGGGRAPHLPLLRVEEPRLRRGRVLPAVLARG